MCFKLILFKLMVFVYLSCSKADIINKDNTQTQLNTEDLQTSATSAKLLNLGSLLGYGNTGYYPNYNRPGYYYPNYNYNTGYYPTVGKYPTTGTYYPNNNYYPPTGPGTNILGGGNGGYGGYGGNGGLQQYYGYWNPSYTGQRNLGYGYYSNTDQYGLPKYTSNSQYYRGYA